MSIENLPHKIQIELVKLLFQQIKITLWAESFAAISLTIALWGAQNPVLLISWLAFNLICCGLARHIMLYCYNLSTRKKPLTYKRATFWLLIFSIGAFVSGVSWGLTGSLLMVKDDVIRLTFQIMLLLGVTASANSVYSSCRQVYFVFLLPAFIPFTLWLFLQGGIFIILSLLALVYFLIMFAASFNSYQLISKALNLGLKNNDLIEDLSKAKEAIEIRSAEIEKSLSLLNATLEATTDGILVVDSFHNIENYNKNFLEMWKIPVFLLKERDTEKKIIDYVKEQLLDQRSFVDKVEKLYNNPLMESFDELLFKDGRVYEQYSKPQMIGDKCVGRVWIFRDTTGRKLLESKLYRQANFDSLTGLPNRVLVQDRITQAILHAQRQNLLIAILFIDLDRFKMINDTLGHSVGDKLLKLAAERLASCVKADDTVARVGGDEFLIILHALTDEKTAIEVARYCLAKFIEAFYIDEHKFTITLSIGISFYPQDGSVPELLIRNADIAMYKAKEMGNNAFLCFTEELNYKVQSRLILENKLRDALHQNELLVLYQPIFNLKTNRIVGAEALIRWEHPVLGSISPSEFISIAEESGMIVSIGEWILKTAIQQTKILHDKGFNDLYISVNLSARQFAQTKLFEKIKIILFETQFKPECLTLELTESLIMDNIEKNILLLKKLKKLGILVAIDDFGIGYSSLNYLKQLPLDKLKIDISFVKDIALHADGAAITAAIIALAAKLHLKVVAEGVEEKEQLDFLIEHHCDEIQGFYFSKPLDAETYTRLLEENVTTFLPFIK